MADAESLEAPARQEKARGGRGRKWLLGLAAALILLLGGGLLLLNTPIGERFLASRIAERTFPNGLNIRIGRIDGNLYGAAVLHDVKLSDPQACFSPSPAPRWTGTGWLAVEQARD